MKPMAGTPTPEALQLYNSRIIDNYLKLIRKRYPNIPIDQVLSYAGITEFEALDEGHWFTQDQVNRFHYRLAQYANNTRIAREAGRYAASPDALGAMRHYILGMVSPWQVFELFQKAASRFTRSSKDVSRKLTPSKFEITVKPNPGVKEEPFQCENRMGFFEASLSIFSAKPPKIEHPECLFKGGGHCRYIVSFEPSSFHSTRWVRNILALLFLLLNVGCLALFPLKTAASVLTISLFLLFIVSTISSYLERRDLISSLGHLKSASDELIDQIQINYNSSLMTNEIGIAVSKQTRLEEIPLKKRAATRGDAVVEVKAGDAVTGLTLPWRLERFLAPAPAAKKKQAVKHGKA